MESAPLFEDLAESPPGGAACWVTTTDDKRIRFATWGGGTRGTILIFPGRSEYIEKYGRVIEAFVSRDFDVVALDWRGQGLSTRPGNSTDVGHVDAFADYQRDIQAVLGHPAVTGLSGPRVMLAHSMGGCIGLRALHDGLDVKAAIFSAPMWGMGLGSFMNPALKALSTLGCAFKQDRRHPVGANSEFYTQKQPFKGNSLTNNPDTYDWFRSHLGLKPQLGLGGPSMRWVKEAFAETAALAALPAPMPCLTFLGTEETVVDPVAIRSQMAKEGAGKLVVCVGAKHEILMETNDVLSRAWLSIDSWLSQAGL